MAISQFTKKLLNFCNHGPLGCSPNDIILTGENKNGLISLFTFKCKMCNITCTIENDTCEDNYLNLNVCAVAGTIAIGCGRSQLEEVLSAINLPSLTEKTYDHNHKVIGKHWKKVAVMNMEEAGKREKELALAQGKVTKEGYGAKGAIKKIILLFLVQPLYCEKIQEKFFIWELRTNIAKFAQWHKVQRLSRGNTCVLKIIMALQPAWKVLFSLKGLKNL